MKTLIKMTELSSISIKGLAIALLVFFAACESDEVNHVEDGVDVATLEAEATAESDYDEVDDITSNIMELAEANAGGRIGESDGNDERCRCAEITHDKENKTITIDFGDGCEGPNGVVRAGIIFITYSGPRFVPGSFWTVTFRDYFVNRRKIEGLRTVTNVSDSRESNPTFHITLEGGKVTWPDGAVATREVDKTRVWVRAANPLLDEVHILAGSTTAGTNKSGVSYKTQVLNDLIYKRSCRSDGRKVRKPVAGTKEISKGDRTCVIDYGDGECDNLTTITCNSDEALTLDVNE